MPALSKATRRTPTRPPRFTIPNVRPLLTRLHHLLPSTLSLPDLRAHLPTASTLLLTLAIHILTTRRRHKTSRRLRNLEDKAYACIRHHELYSALLDHPGRLVATLRQTLDTLVEKRVCTQREANIVFRRLRADFHRHERDRVDLRVEAGCEVGKFDEAFVPAATEMSKRVAEEVNRRVNRAKDEVKLKKKKKKKVGLAAARKRELETGMAPERVGVLRAKGPKRADRARRGVAGLFQRSMDVLGGGAEVKAVSKPVSKTKFKRKRLVVDEVEAEDEDVDEDEEASEVTRSIEIGTDWEPVNKNKRKRWSAEWKELLEWSPVPKRVKKAWGGLLGAKKEGAEENVGRNKVLRGEGMPEWREGDSYRAFYVEVPLESSDEDEEEEQDENGYVYVYQQGRGGGSTASRQEDHSEGQHGAQGHHPDKSADDGKDGAEDEDHDEEQDGNDDYEDDDGDGQDDSEDNADDDGDQAQDDDENSSRSYSDETASQDDYDSDLDVYEGQYTRVGSPSPPPDGNRNEPLLVIPRNPAPPGPWWLPFMI
ncbi:hypothetical protein M011DRAFT_253306 [Sporormia fimetaria CBS 119925]|uniref:Uncharacterized protein n=1 Tax=Sporormia fimetaria CBS 119925 TaxID=1340428 RepID=A0A6A6UZX4_9PLEO|nr:hypothetical protein M011DRAFT_253306 [Sporormia fimetaria CBS 119925]